MKCILTDHMRVFVSGEVSVLSLSYAAQAERVDTERASQVLAVLAGWDSGARSITDLRARVARLL